MKRYNCTVSDKRGEFGLCMEKSQSGKFVLFSDYFKLEQELDVMKRKYALLKNKSKFADNLSKGMGVGQAFKESQKC
jgi:hypothetical protein